MIKTIRTRALVALASCLFLVALSGCKIQESAPEPASEQSPTTQTETAPPPSVATPSAAQPAAPPVAPGQLTPEEVDVLRSLAKALGPVLQARAQERQRLVAAHLTAQQELSRAQATLPAARAALMEALGGADEPARRDDLTAINGVVGGARAAVQAAADALAAHDRAPLLGGTP